MVVTRTYFFRIRKIVVFIGCLYLLNSCTAPKFTFEQNGIGELSFHEGKWLINDVLASKNQQDLLNHSLKKWGQVITDSLFTIDDIRKDKLISDKIKFELNSDELSSLKLGSGCDFLINTKVDVLSEELSALSSPRESEFGNTIRSNEVKVEIRIYDLNKHTLISSRAAFGTLKETTGENGNNGISLALNTEGIAINGIDRIIDYYTKNKKSTTSQL